MHDRRWLFVAAALLGVVAWLVVWDTTRPRTSWDSLMYHRFALEYAGVPVEEQERVAESIFATYASPRDVEAVEAGLREGGSVWDALEVPARERWVDLYRSRPLYGLLVAAAYPFLGPDAPLLVSALAALLFTMSLALGAGRVVGFVAGFVAVLLSFANPLFARWLIFLQPDGLAIGLWTACLALSGLYVRFGQARWILMLFAAAVALSFTRPLGVFLPIVLGTCAVVALVARRPAWKRLALGTGATAIPTAIFTAYSYLLGLPTLNDVLQDLPSRHFLRPEVANPLGWTVGVAARQIESPLLPTLVGEPTLWVPLVLGVIGLVVVGHSWAIAPFVASIAIVPFSYLIHPQLSEAPRTMAPIWVSLHLGIALALVGLISRMRGRTPSALPVAGPRDRGSEHSLDLNPVTDP